MDLDLIRLARNGEIVGDALLLLAEEMLASLGYEPAGFSSAREATDALAADPAQYDVAVIDYLLPGMTGIELTRRF